MQSSTPTGTAYSTISSTTRAATPWHSSRQEELAPWYRNEAIAYGLSHGIILQHDLPAHDPIFLLSSLEGTQITLPDERTPTISEYERPKIPCENEVLALLLQLPSSLKDDSSVSPLEWILAVQGGKDIKFDVSDIMLASGNQRLEHREWLGAIKWAHDTDMVTTWLPLRFDALESLRAEGGDEPVDAMPDFHTSRKLPRNWLEPKIVQEQLEGEIHRRRISLLEELHITPPLMPAMSAEDGYERATPGVEDLQLELEPLSDPASLWSLDMMSAETAIGVGDERPSSRPSIGEVGCPSVEEVVGCNRNLVDLTIEPPMLPPSTDGTETSSDEIRKQLQTLWLAPSTESVQPSGDAMENEFKESLASIAAETLRVMEQEKFLPADATARFQVVPVDFSVPDPPWRKIGRNIADHFAFVCEEAPELGTLSPAPKSPFSERQLSWRPLQGKPAEYVMTETLYHSIEGEDSWDCWRQDIDENPFLPSRPALAELDYGDDEDMATATPEDTPVVVDAPPPAADDLGELIRKRRAEEGGLGVLHKRQRLQDTDILQYSAAYSASQRVENYMQRNGYLAISSGGTPSYSTAVLPQLTSRAIAAPKDAAQQQPAQGKIDTGANRTRTKPRALPPLRLPEHPCRVIASMKCLDLTREILKLWSKVEFIDREMSLHDTFYRDPDSLEQRRVVSPLSYEADLIISPLTGILLTDLATIVKESTPGEQELATFRERVCRVAPLYGYLAILVAEGTEEGVSMLEPADWIAYNDFIAFTSSLPWTISVTLAGEGKAALAQWAIAIMCRHAHEGAQLGYSIVPQEMAEEILLRRAGFNIYAAQVTISVTPGWMMSLAGTG